MITFENHLHVLLTYIKNTYTVYMLEKNETTNGDQFWKSSACVTGIIILSAKLYTLRTWKDQNNKQWSVWEIICMYYWHKQIYIHSVHAWKDRNSSDWFWKSSACVAGVIIILSVKIYTHIYIYMERPNNNDWLWKSLQILAA